MAAHTFAQLPWRAPEVRSWQTMYSIDAEFLRFDEVRFGDVFGATGVYVLWTRDAAVKPSYIGEGDIVERVQSHRKEKKWGTRIQTGCVALMGKDDAEVVEALLLDAAKDLFDSLPTYNTHPGKFSRVGERFTGSDRTVRVKVSGWHPLREGARVQGSVLLHARLERIGEEGCCYRTEHPWRASSGRTRA